VTVTIQKPVDLVTTIDDVNMSICLLAKPSCWRLYFIYITLQPISWKLRAHKQRSR